MTVFALASGLRLRQRYVLDAPLGTGGMSEVWRADDEVLRRPVAVKALAPNLAADPALREGVRREARAVASLNHPHITRVYDHGRTRVCRSADQPDVVVGERPYRAHLQHALRDSSCVRGPMSPGAGIRAGRG